METEIKVIYYDAKGCECESMWNAIRAELTACVPAEKKQATVALMLNLAAEHMADHDAKLEYGVEAWYNPQTGMYNIGCEVVK